MIIGIVLSAVFFLLLLNPVNRYVRNDAVRSRLRAAHKILGAVFLMLAIVHIAVTWHLMKQRPAEVYVLGFVMTAAAGVCALSFLQRARLKEKWLTLHRVSTAVIFICLALHVYLCAASLADYRAAVSQISISDVKLSEVSDGTYTGECGVGYIYASVQVNVQGGEIKSIELMEHRNEKGKPAEAVINRIIESQAIEVDAVTGATNSSRVIMKAVQNALSARE